MLTEPEKRAILKAVSRFISDASMVKQVFEASLDSRSAFDSESFVNDLITNELISQSEALELEQQLSKVNFLAQPTDSRLNRRANGLASTMLERARKKPRIVHDDANLEKIGSIRFLRKLGEGGMSSVFLGYDEVKNTSYAVKVLPPELAATQSILDRFYREGRSGSYLNHPNIVKVFHCGYDEQVGRHFLVQEYVDGQSALDLVATHERLTVSDSVHIILDIARGLEHAHSRNIIHRDIKPDNILITKSGLAKLADLGLAKRTDEPSHLTAARQGFGTPYYMPYEQALNAKNIDGRSDIYALGATFYHLVTGAVPFSGDSYLEIVEKKSVGFFLPASSVNPDVPSIVDNIIAKMMARNPDDRYQTVSELIVDLERSHLAPRVPSFVDSKLAIQDPVIRQRLEHLAMVTKLETPQLVNDQREENDLEKTQDDAVWFVQFRLSNRRWCKVKATASQIARRLKERKIPFHAKLSKTARGKFQSIGQIDEFAKLVADLRRQESNDGDSDTLINDSHLSPHDDTENAPNHLRWVLALAIGSTAILLAMLFYWLFW